MKLQLSVAIGFLALMLGVAVILLTKGCSGDEAPSAVLSV